MSCPFLRTSNLIQYHPTGQGPGLERTCLVIGPGAGSAPDSRGQTSALSLGSLVFAQHCHSFWEVSICTALSSFSRKLPHGNRENAQSAKLQDLLLGLSKGQKDGTMRDRFVRLQHLDVSEQSGSELELTIWIPTSHFCVQVLAPPLPDA